MGTVYADTWTVDTEAQWNTYKDSSYNDTVNTTGLLLDADFHTIFYDSHEEYGVGEEVFDLGNKDLTIYDLAFFQVELRRGGTGTAYATFRNDSGTNTIVSHSSTSDNYAVFNSSFDALNYGGCSMWIAGPIGQGGWGKNWYLKGMNYTTNGYWNSSWYDFTNPQILNQLNFSIDNLGGGITYKVETSDNAASIKDSTSWTDILATGDVYHYPDLSAARYMRIRFNLTSGSTPLIDSYSFMVSENATPNIVSTDPTSGQQGVETSIEHVNVTIHDAEGDLFNYTIETSPNIGHRYGNNTANGTKQCNVSGLIGGTTYTVYVNASDTAGNILNASYTFTTFGSVEFWCYDETLPNVSISPFSLQISNGHAYNNDTINSGDGISIANLPFGDNVVFVVSADGYETRVYTYTISAVSDYNFSFYLPPVSNTELRYNSTSVSNPAVDAVVSLECEPYRISVVQAWNESLYGHWYMIPEDKWGLSGSTVTVDSSMLDDNTTLVQVQYYCNVVELDYVIHVINTIGSSINEARVNVSIIYGSEYISVHSVITDGNGDATVPLIPGNYYKISITKEGYVTETADYIPTESVRTKTYQLTFSADDTNATHWLHDISINAEFTNGCTLFLNYTDSLSNTSMVNVTVERWNGSSYNSTVYYYNDTLDSFSVSTHLICDFAYRVVFTIDHGDHGLFNHTILLNNANLSVTSVSELENKFTEILGSNPFGWVNFFAIFFMLACLFSFGEVGAGISLLGTGFGLLFLNVLIVGFIASTMVPILFIVLGMMVEWKHARRNA